MVVGHFLKWISTARVADRAIAANALARAFVAREMAFEDRCAAEAALTLLLDDPSWKVRRAIAEAVAGSAHAPIQIIAALAGDQPEVAEIVLARSPLLTDADLIDRVASAAPATQRLIAQRANVSLELSAAIAETGDAEACHALVVNPGAQIAQVSFRRIAERHAQNARLRAALADDARLPSDCRHVLMESIASDLQRVPLVRAVIGERRAERIAREARTRGSLVIVDQAKPQEHAGLAEHLRERGDLSAAFMIRAIACGKVDFFGAALVALTGQSEHRVRGMLAGGGDTAISALLRTAGLAPTTYAVILKALKIWREVARGKRLAGPQEVSWSMLSVLGGQTAKGDIATLLKSIHLDALRANAREHALAIAAA